jgi:hypothetical protein
MAAPSCNVNVCDAPEALAVSVTVWTELSAEAAAVNTALVAPVGTVTNAGTVTALLSLVKLTLTSLLVAISIVTVQTSVVEPVSKLLAHVSPLSVAAGAASVPAGTAVPVPLMFTASGEAPVESVIITLPEAAPGTVGLNWTPKLNELPASTVIGRLPWALELKVAPLTSSLEILTGADPWFNTFIYWLAVRPTGTEPNVTFELEAVSPKLPAAVLNEPPAPHPARAKKRMSEATDASTLFVETALQTDMQSSPKLGILVTIFSVTSMWNSKEEQQDGQGLPMCGF